MKIKEACVLLSVALSGVLLSLLPLTIPVCKVPIAIDSCADSGGCWDYQRNVCIQSEELQQSCVGGKDSHALWVACSFLPTCMFIVSACGVVASLVILMALMLLKLWLIGVRRVRNK
jgi:hypothetical protein